MAQCNGTAFDCCKLCCCEFDPHSRKLMIFISSSTCSGEFLQSTHKYFKLELHKTECLESTLSWLSPLPMPVCYKVEAKNELALHYMNIMIFRINKCPKINLQLKLILWLFVIKQNTTNVK